MTSQLDQGATQKERRSAYIRDEGALVFKVPCSRRNTHHRRGLDQARSISTMLPTAERERTSLKVRVVPEGAMLIISGRQGCIVRPGIRGPRRSRARVPRKRSSHMLRGESECGLGVRERHWKPRGL